MRSRINPDQWAKGDVFRDGKLIINQRLGPVVASGLGLRGLYTVEHWRNGRRYNEYRLKNDITNEGRNKLLDVMFDAATQITIWYLGIIDDINFSALSNADTYDEINQSGNGWDEFTDYTDANNGDSALTRPIWPTGPAASQSITNATLAVYDLTGPGTVKGLFTVGGGSSPETKGDHTAGSTLWATALFSGGDAIVQSGDQLRVTYTVSA